MNKVGISLGWNCHSACWGAGIGIRATKENGYLTCPFDLMVSNYTGIIDCLNDDFKYLCDEQYLEMQSPNPNESEIYNTKYNFVFVHESPGVANLYITENWPEGINHFINNNYANLKKRYEKRVANFRNYLKSPDTFITFILTTWNKTQEDITPLKEAIEKYYPNLQYSVLLINDPKGKDYLLRHLKGMRLSDEDPEVKRLL